MIPYGRQSIDEDDIHAVVEALRSSWLTTGPKVAQFEQALADFCGAKHAIAVSSGTAALHVAMLAARIGTGQRVLTSANTFLASANCAEYVGAITDFADIDEHTANATAETFQAAWHNDVRAVVPVDFAGRPCDLPAIAAFARERDALVIEDASHAIGSQFWHDGRCYRVGGHPWADMTTFSFHPVKSMTSGEGGAILTNHHELDDRCRLLRNHGMVHGAGPSAEGSDIGSEYGPWVYSMTELGYNYRITDLQCALGLSQLEKLDVFVRRRSEIVDRYNQAFANLDHVRAPCSGAAPGSVDLVAWHLYVLQIDFDALGITRSEVMATLREKGAMTQVHYIPVHLQPYYRNKYGYGPGKCPVAESYYAQCLSLPLFPGMADSEVDHVIAAVETTLRTR